MINDRYLVTVNAVVEDERKVLADPLRLEQMLGNLVGNALKYGRAPFVVGVRPHPDDEQLVAIDVTDSGDGVPVEFQDQLFREFTRAGGSVATGTGLGLYVVRSLAEAQGGTVDLRGVRLGWGLLHDGPAGRLSRSNRAVLPCSSRQIRPSKSTDSTVRTPIQRPRRQTTIDWLLCCWRTAGTRVPEAAGPAGDGLAQRLAGGVELGEQLLVARREGGDAVLEVEDPAYALDADAGRGEVGDLAQQVDVARRVAAAATAGAAGPDQPHPLVGAQRLRVQPGQLGRDADHEHSGVRGRCPEERLPVAHAFPLWVSRVPARRTAASRERVPRVVPWGGHEPASVNRLARSDGSLPAAR